MVGAATPDGDPVSVTLEETVELPQAFSMKALPNPFNDALSIVFELPVHTDLSLRIVNPLGQLIRTLKTQRHPAGRFWTQWDGLDELRRPVGSGAYLVVFETSSSRLVHWVTFLK